MNGRDQFDKLMEISAVGLNLKPGMFTDLAFRGEAGGRNAQRSLMEGENIAGAIVDGVDCAVNRDVLRGGGASMSSFGAVQYNVDTRMRIAHASGPRGLGC